MTTFVLYLIPIILSLQYLNYLRIINLTLEAENALISIQNKLRLSAINGELDDFHNEYQRLDTMLRNAISGIGKTNIWFVAFSSFIDNKNASLAKYTADPFFLSKNKVQILRIVLSDTTGIMLRYLIKKSVLLSVVYYSFGVVGKIFDTTKKIQPLWNKFEHVVFDTEVKWSFAC